MHSLLDVLLDGQFDMRAQFFVEIRVQLTAPKKRIAAADKQRGSVSIGLDDITDS